MYPIQRPFIRPTACSKIMFGIGVPLSILTLGMFYFFFYEMFFRNHYWKNRFRLYNYLSTGQGEVVYIGELPLWDQVHVYEYKLKSHTYKIQVFRSGDAVTLDCIDCSYKEALIGMWTFSPTMYFMNKRINRELTRRCNNTQTKLL